MADGGGEGRAVGAVVDEAALQFQGEVALGAADEDGLEQLAQGLVGDLGADPQAGDLLLVLDHPQLLDRAAEVGEAQPGRDRADGAVPGHGEVVLLHGEGVGALRRGHEAAAAAGGVAAGPGSTWTRTASSGGPRAELPLGRARQSRRSSLLPSSSTAPCGAAPAR